MKEALRKGIPSISHRGDQYKNIHAETLAQLRNLLDVPEDYEILFTSSATESWEHLIRNCVNNESFHLVNGAFGEKFWQASGILGKNNLKHQSVDGSCVDVSEVSIPDSTELLALTLNESSTGVSFPVSTLEAIREKYPNPIIAVDGVSSVPIPAMDLNLIDALYFSVQKCFGLPAGLGVLIVSPKVLEKAGEIESATNVVGSYRSIPKMVSASRKHQTIETPNVLAIYLLGQVINDMLTKGLDMIRRESKYKAAVIYQLVDDHPELSAFVKDPNNRSETVITIETKSPKRFITPLYDKGFVIGSGYGKYNNSQIRIANFPTHSKEQIELLADTILAL